MSSRKKTHSGCHKFIQVIGKYIKVWRCAYYDCSFSLHNSMKEMLLGRASKCWNCDTEFRIDERNLDEEMPMCSTCYLKSKDMPVDTDLEILIREKRIEQLTKPIEEINNPNKSADDVLAKLWNED